MPQKSRGGEEEDGSKKHEAFSTYARVSEFFVLFCYFSGFTQSSGEAALVAPSASPGTLVLLCSGSRTEPVQGNTATWWAVSVFDSSEKNWGSIPFWKLGFRCNSFIELYKADFIILILHMRKLRLKEFPCITGTRSITVCIYRAL